MRNSLALMALVSCAAAGCYDPFARSLPSPDPQLAYNMSLFNSMSNLNDRWPVDDPLAVGVTYRPYRKSVSSSKWCDFVALELSVLLYFEDENYWDPLTAVRSRCDLDAQEILVGVRFEIWPPQRDRPEWAKERGYYFGGHWTIGLGYVHARLEADTGSLSDVYSDSGLAAHWSSGFVMQGPQWGWEVSGRLAVWGLEMFDTDEGVEMLSVLFTVTYAF
ncbi:MAG: hypothetical protein ACYTFI_07195 [Planctomycetota bacterium]